MVIDENFFSFDGPTLVPGTFANDFTASTERIAQYMNDVTLESLVETFRSLPKVDPAGVVVLPVLEAARALRIDPERMSVKRVACVEGDYIKVAVAGELTMSELRVLQLAVDHALDQLESKESSLAVEVATGRLLWPRGSMPGIVVPEKVIPRL